MGFLQRSKSEAVTERTTKKKAPKAVHTTGHANNDDQKRSTSFDRPKTADASSFSRPRTASAAIGRSIDLQRTSFKIDFMAGNELFSFPMPSPRLQPPRSATMERVPPSLCEPNRSAIGLAIGSPTHARPGWGRSITVDSASPRMPVQPPPARPPPPVPMCTDVDMSSSEVKKKKTSWKTLGGLLSRRPTTAPIEGPFYKLKMPNAIEERDILIADIAELPEYGSTPCRESHQESPWLTRGQARFEARVEAARAALIPDGRIAILRSPSTVQKQGFSPMFRTINGVPEDEPLTDDPRKDSPLSVISKQSFRYDAEREMDSNTPRLDLDLPSPRLDRYSVMFEKVLDDAKPSLLERRQSRLSRAQSIKKLDLAPKIVDQQALPRLEVNGVPQQNVPSPGLAKSLSVRLGRKALSPVIEVFTALNRPRPIRRSKTAPTSASSPLAGIFKNSRIEVQSTSPGSTCATEFSMPLSPMTTTTISDSGSVDFINSDPELVRRSMEQSEPDWDMITNGNAEGGHRHPYLRVKSPADLEKHIVQVSVARQVSVSNAMQQVRQSVDCKRPLRPKMVELSKNRTSTAVLIEIAEE